VCWTSQRKLGFSRICTTLGHQPSPITEDEAYTVFKAGLAGSVYAVLLKEQQVLLDSLDPSERTVQHVSGAAA
jgi:hypothetical protein